MRLRLTFAKTDAMRFTGHMDLHRSIERTLRRAGLPVSHSQGFTKRPKINLASALPLGVTGERELADIWLDADLPDEDFVRRFREAAPPGIYLHAAVPVSEEAAKLQNAVHSSDFDVTLLEPIPDLDAKVDALLAADTLPRTRRDKPYDLRPLIVSLSIGAVDSEGCRHLQMTLLTQDSATGRADEVVAELGGDPLATRICRTAIHLVET